MKEHFWVNQETEKKTISLPLSFQWIQLAAKFTQAGVDFWSKVMKVG